MIFNLVFSVVLSLSAQSAEQCKQIDCADAVSFSDGAMANLSQLNSNLMRMRELAFESSNGAIGNKERGFLNEEFEAWRDENFRIIKQASFVDIFQDQHFYLRDGFKFKTPIKIPHGNFAYLQEFTFDSLNEKEFGALARARLDLRDPDPSFKNIFYQLEINGHRILSSAGRDYVSTRYPVLSAISLAAAINSNAGYTGVRAKVEETVVEVADIDFDALEAMGELQAGSISINNVDIVGSVQGLHDLIDLINEFKYSTGVSARHTAGTSDHMDLYAADGRNIELEIKDKIAEVMNLEDGVHVFNGSIELVSGNAFGLILIAGFPILVDFDDANHNSILVEIDSATALYSADIGTQESAQDAIEVINQSFIHLQDRMIQALKPSLLCK